RPGQRSAASPGRSSQAGDHIRADVTYLRPDFSVALPVENPGLWPKMQRYDFFVRTRPAQPWEADRPATGGAYPQREAVLRALRQITGQDFGERSEDWRAGLRRAGYQV